MPESAPFVSFYHFYHLAQYQKITFHLFTTFSFSFILILKKILVNPKIKLILSKFTFCL